MLLSAWILVIVYLPAALGLFYLAHLNQRALAFAFLPLAVALLYAWIAVFDPAIEQTREIVRQVFLAMGAWLDYLVFSHIIEEHRKKARRA